MDTCDTCGGPLYVSVDAPAFTCLVKRSDIPGGADDWRRVTWHHTCVPSWADVPGYDRYQQMAASLRVSRDQARFR